MTEIILTVMVVLYIILLILLILAAGALLVSAVYDAKITLKNRKINKL